MTIRNCTVVAIGLTILATLLFPSCVYAGTYSGGTGDPNFPYQIADVNDLLELAAETGDYDKHFVLTADIDLSGRVYNSALISYSVGRNKPENPFSGSFDGDGYVIENLAINNINQSYIGLFGYIGLGGEIKNLRLESFNLIGYSYIGAVAGKNKGNIINCFSEVNIQIDYDYAGGIVGENDWNISLSNSFSNIHGNSSLGGLVGRNNGTIDECESEGVVETDFDNSSFCGGLVGFNYGEILNCMSNSTVYGGNSSVGGLAGSNHSGMIEKCYSNGDVNGLEYSTGGLVGYNAWGEIYNCFSNGNVSGKYYIGGLVGWNSLGDISCSYATGNVLGEETLGGLIGSTSQGKITNCYSTGDVNGIQYIGGLSGGISGVGSIINCYATGKVIGNENKGGLLGYDWSNAGIIIESFWDFESSGIMTSVGGIGKSTTQMQTAATFINAGWDFNTPVWTIDEGIDYPRLWWEMVIGPVDLLIELSENIDAMSLPKGITNSLQVKLDAALLLLEDENSLLAKLSSAAAVLEDDNPKNDKAAINSLRAFINAVQAQRGKKIPEVDADTLISDAQQIIDMLSSE